MPSFKTREEILILRDSKKYLIIALFLREDETENDISQVLPLLLLRMSLKRFEVAIQISFFYSCLQLGLEQLIVTNIKVESTILSSLY